MSLRVRGVHKRFGGREVLRGADLDGARGERVAVMGRNGTGKSTLLGVVAGLLEPDRGEVTLDGIGLLGREVRARARLGYVPEAADAPAHLTVGELIALVRALKRAAPPGDDLLERIGVTPLVDQLVGSLSLGQRRRACLAAALVGNPDLLVLDEPTNGLDAAGVDALATLLRERGEAGGIALIATHDEAFAEAVGARRVRIAEGRVTG